jgi:anti-sigma B factor antagonist
MADVIGQCASLDVVCRDGVHTVVLSGELDLACSAAIETSIESVFADEPSALLLDLSALTFMDSTGLKLLLQIQEHAEATGCALAVVPGPSSVQRVFELTGLAKAMPWVHEDLVVAD